MVGNDVDVDTTEETEAWVKDIGNKDVGELGFSADFISPRIPKPPAREEVMGPITLNELHPYQEATATLVCQTLAAPSGKNKGLVQLPTGAGKTRVAVESLIRNAKRLHREGQTRHVILWIAQTDELCEQAVAAWTSAWRAIGIPREQMIVSRLWAAGRSNVKTVTCRSSSVRSRHWWASPGPPTTQRGRSDTSGFPTGRRGDR